MKNKSKLAIHGGVPIRKKPMPFRCAFGKDEERSIIAVINYYRLNRQDPPYQGYFEKKFCDEFVKFMGGGYADAVSTGTASVFVALEALELPKRSEVIISPVTDSGPLNCVIMQGFTPVLADSAPDSYNMGVEQFLSRVTSKTSALLAVHCAGEPLEINKIVIEARKRGVRVLEDCSQAPGAICNGDKVGSFGDIAAFSTMYRKTLATGGSGGLVYTKDPELYHRALACADRGKQSWRTDLNLNDPSSALFPALNFNTNEFSCGIGIASLKRLQKSIDKRVFFLLKLIKLINTYSKVCRPYAFSKSFSPFFFPVLVDVNKLNCTKIDFAKAIAAEGIGLLTHFGCVISGWPWAQPYLSDKFITKNALNTRDNSFNLYLNENYKEQEAQDIISAIVKAENYFLKK